MNGSEMVRSGVSGESDLVSHVLTAWPASRRRFGAPLVLMAALTMLCGFAASAAGQGFRFRAEATRVLVDVLVLDEDGLPTPGLGISDFRLFEDGVEQRITGLEVVSSRVSAGSGVPSAVAAADAPAGPEAAGRRFVIVFNRRGAGPANLRRAKRGLREFVTNDLTPDDETMILDLGPSLRVLQEFRPGREEALASVRRIVPGPFESLVGSDRDVRDSFRMLAGLADALEPVDGRKIVLFFSVGLATFADSRARGPLGQRRFDEGNALFDTIRQLNHANATLYAVDLEGVFEHEDRILTAGPGGSGGDSFDQVGIGSGDANFPGGEVYGGGAASLAVATGGEYFPNSTNFAVPLARVARQNDLYYLLSYSPERAELDGGYRELEVRLRDESGAGVSRVVARPGYFARERRGASPPETAARGAFDYFLPETIHTYAYLLNTIPGGAAVALHAALPESSLGDESELVLRMIAGGGGALGEARAPVDRQRFFLSASARVPVGDHRLEVRVGGLGETPDRTVSTGVRVPEDYGRGFSLSSVFPFAAESHEGEADPPVRPVAAFARGETARVGFFVFPGAEEPVRRARVAYEIRNERGETRIDAERRRLLVLDPEEADGAPFEMTLRTGDLGRGRYTVFVRLEERGGRRRSAASELEFEIR